MMLPVNPFRPFPSGPRVRGGFTLVELTLSLFITSIIMGAMGSAMMIAARSLPNPDSRSGNVLEAGRIVNEIAAELTYAVTIEKAISTEIRFTVVRQGVPVEIRYEWSGTPGDPLERRYDGGPAVIVAENVREFSLAYESETLEEAVPLIESAEILLNSHVAASSSTLFAIDDTNWIGQYFQPMGLPAAAVSWSVTRVQFEAQSRGKTDGETLVQLRAPTPSYLPDALVLGQQTMLESDLQSTLFWQDFSFSAVSGLDPNTGLCLVLEWVSDKHSAEVRYGNNPGSDRVVTSNAGGTWTKDTNLAMNYYVYGTYSTLDPSPPPPVGQILAVNLSLNLTDDPATKVLTKSWLLNHPVN